MTKFQLFFLIQFLLSEIYQHRIIFDKWVSINKFDYYHRIDRLNAENAVFKENLALFDFVN